MMIFVHKVVTLNICCNVACLAFHLPYIKTSFQTHQCQPRTGFSPETPTFGGMQHPFKWVQSDEKIVHYFKVAR